jgi:isoquinoline 1-oxidoreductase beta subunit
MKLSGGAGAALCLGLFFPAGAQVPEIVRVSGLDPANIEMNAWILINPSGKVTLVSHRAEMGQGVYHSLAQIIAEELEVNLADVDIIFAQGDRKKYGSQITGGSSTIRTSYKRLLQLSAAARIVLIQAAASRWGVAVPECYAEGGIVIHKPTGRKLNYGQLVAEASKLMPPKDIVLKKPSEYRLIRKPLLRVDTPLKTNGSAIFGLDKKLPGMLYATVEHNPRLRGVVKSYDDSAALKVPGVRRVFKVRMQVFNTYREGVAVVANSTWAAMLGKKALKVEWDDTGFEHVNSEEIFRRQEEYLMTRKGLVVKTQGDPDGIIDHADHKLDVLYQTPYQSHSPMEPLNCVAHYQPDKLEIWGPIQAPEWVQDSISKELGLPVEKVIVNMTFLGGGFGRKAFMDYPHEAALISKEMAAPVQVVWTREDDMTQGPYRAGISYRGEAVVTDGKVGAVRFHMAGQNIDHWRGSPVTAPNRSTTEGFLRPYFSGIANISFSDIPFELPIPNMWWRSVYASTNGFAYESFMDELAFAAKADPLEFRRSYLPEDRCQRLIDKLAEVAGWRDRGEHRGYGCAITECFGTTVGQVVKVSRSSAGKVQIDHVWAVVDCGWYVNPDIIKAQVEGAIIMGYGAAAFHEITFKDGLTEQKNFYAYKMPRINDIPRIDVYIMDNDADAGGIGEPGLPAFAPALANAIFDLTGKRVRKLPLDMSAL